MGTTANKIRQQQGVSLFYYLKITGIPYYFTCVVDPTESKYGGNAWTLPTGYTTVRGMMVPDDGITQKLGDVVGGIASAETLRLTMLDVKVTDSHGTHGYLSRLVSPGRFGLNIPLPELAADIPVSADAGDTISFRSAGAGATVGSLNGVVHVGGEAIRVVDAVVADGAGEGTLTIAARNVWPCSSVYPPKPFHDVYKVDARGLPGVNQYITAEPYTFIGRSAAFYIGHMEANGPCLESETMRRTVGKITSVRYNETGSFDIEITSVMGDLVTAQVAPGLSTTHIAPGQICITKPFSAFYFGYEGNSSDTSTVFQKEIVKVATGNYSSVYDIVARINTALNDVYQQKVAAFTSLVPRSGFAGPAGIDKYIFRCGTMMINGKTYVEFHVTKNVNAKVNLFVEGDAGNYTGVVGLLRALGFEPGKHTASPVTNDFEYGQDYAVGDVVRRNGKFYMAIQPVAASDYIAPENPSYPGYWTESVNVPPIIADRPVPGVFIPISVDDTQVSFRVLDENAHFFTDQGDAGGEAYIRYGDGQIAQVHGQVGSLLTAGGVPTFLQAPQYTTVANHKVLVVYPVISFYRTEVGMPATVEQVVIVRAPSPNTTGLGRMLGRLLYSTGAQSNAALDAYPQGVGFGFGGMVNTASFEKFTAIDGQRAMVLDATSKFTDLFTAIAKEYGLFLVWDPEDGQVRLVDISVPSVAGLATPNLTESNRATTGDRTKQVIDQSNIRSSWTINWGWDYLEGKFNAPVMTYSDTYVRSNYGTVSKSEKIDDKSLVMTDDSLPDGGSGTQVLGQIISHSYFNRQPWVKCSRTVDKSVIVYCPGKAYKVQDATMINPFTGDVGVTLADDIYALVMSVSTNFAAGKGTVDFLVNQYDPHTYFRPYSPTGLLDRNDVNFGYDNATGVITFVAHFSGDGITYDGVAFAVGDKGYIISREDASVQFAATVSAVATDGHTITVQSGLGVLSVTQEYLFVLAPYTTSTTARQAAVAFQGNENGHIVALSKNCRWT